MQKSHYCVSVALQAEWWGPICIFDVLIILAGRLADLVRGEGAAYNGRLSQTTPYIFTLI